MDRSRDHAGQQQSLVQIGVDKNTTVVCPAPLMSTIGELGTFLAREAAAAAPRTAPLPAAVKPVVVTSNGSVTTPAPKRRTATPHEPRPGPFGPDESPATGRGWQYG